MKDGIPPQIPTGDALLLVLAALANPHRLRIVALLAGGGRNYVSQLARDLGISRPLLHLHLAKLQEAGLVTSRLELSEDGKALNYFDLAPFRLDISADSIRLAAATLSAPGDPPKE
jgi:DNA-binding transcriptional ArsR family regulator